MILKIINGENITEIDEVYSVGLPGKEGRLTIMVKHLPISAVLKKGIIKVTYLSGESEDMEIPAGIFLFQHEVLEVICSEYM